ncbi:hypothetical protein JPSP12_02360 [Staphylococcus pseudintermedius]
MLAPVRVKRMSFSFNKYLFVNSPSGDTLPFSIKVRLSSSISVIRK